MSNSYLSHYENKTVLVTGGAGFLGFNVVRALSPIACDIIVLKNKSHIREDDFSDTAKISIVKGDICDKIVWENILKHVDIVFHFAAQTSSQIANKTPSLDLESNLLPIVNFVETCQRIKLFPHIVFSGTATQVGLTNTYPVNETLRDLPITVYDIDKLAAEKYLQYYSNQLEGNAAILRLANVYGPGPRSGSADRGILNLMVRKALKGEPLTVYGKGHFVRDYVYIDDVVSAFLIAGANMNVVEGEYYLIGSGEGHTILDMVGLVRDEVARRTGRQAEIVHIPPPENLSQIESRNFVADTAKFNAATGWKPMVSLVDGINRIIKHFLAEEKK